MSKNKKKVLVVGGGFVGGTFYEVFHPLNVGDWDIRICDKDPENSYIKKNFATEALVEFEDISWSKKADLVIVAVPTPMNEKTGECYTGIVESVVKQVRSYNQDCWVCIKSTVPPGTTQRLYEIYRKVCFNPEFLTEKNAYKDFTECEYQIIGYPELMPGIWDSLENPLEDLFRDGYECGLFGGKHIVDMSSTQAEMVKYTRNSYLATRLSFFNEIKQICDKLDVDYNRMKHFAGLDMRVGRHYNEVEPPYGFGGHCLPKDLNALKSLGKRLGVKTTVLDAVNEKNLEVRQDRDWEKMKDRAVINTEEK